MCSLAALNSKTDSEKIMYIIREIFHANSIETSVTLKEVINKGIELGVTEDWPIDHTGHPWYPHTSTMMGIGGSMYSEEPSLHREWMKKGNNTCMYYWFDPTKRHKVALRKDAKNTVFKKDFETANPYKGRNLTLIENRPCPVPVEFYNRLEPEEKFAYYEKAYPGEYFLINDKIIVRDWAVKNPNKFRSLYNDWVKTHPVEFKKICNQVVD